MITTHGSICVVPTHPGTLYFLPFSTNFQRTSTCLHPDFQSASTSFFSGKPRGKGVGFNQFSTTYSTIQHVIFHVNPPSITQFSTCYHVISRGFVCREARGYIFKHRPYCSRADIIIAQLKMSECFYLHLVQTIC